jgi:hypothetical protein
MNKYIFTVYFCDFTYLVLPFYTFQISASLMTIFMYCARLAFFQLFTLTGNTFVEDAET